jgi:uncharacterized protein (TIGR00290 family)
MSHAVPEPILLAWSSGKDSAWSLQLLRLDPRVRVVGLLTTVNPGPDRVAVHAVRRVLLEAQAEAAELPLWRVEIPSPCPNDVYEAAMGAAFAKARQQGIRGVAFGDLFLEDIRRYRERQMEASGLRPLFPLWGLPTRPLAEEMIDGGLQARLTCVNSRLLPGAFAGRAFDRGLLQDLPPDVDPCGERGEFHTFAWDGPMFRRPITIEAGEVVSRDGFVYADLRPVS